MLVLCLSEDASTCELEETGIKLPTKGFTVLTSVCTDSAGRFCFFPVKSRSVLRCITHTAAQAVTSQLKLVK